MIELGSKVTFARGDVLVRHSAEIPRGAGCANRFHRSWERRRDVHSWAMDLEEVTHGVVAGWRTLADGDVVPGYYDNPTEWHPTASHKCWIVYFDMRRNPIYLRADDVKEIT